MSLRDSLSGLFSRKLESTEGLESEVLTVQKFDIPRRSGEPDVQIGINKTKLEAICALSGIKKLSINLQQKEECNFVTSGNISGHDGVSTATQIATGSKRLSPEIKDEGSIRALSESNVQIYLNIARIRQELLDAGKICSATDWGIEVNKELVESLKEAISKLLLTASTPDLVIEFILAMELITGIIFFPEVFPSNNNALDTALSVWIAISLMTTPVYSRFKQLISMHHHRAKGSQTTGFLQDLRRSRINPFNAGGMDPYRLALLTPHISRLAGVIDVEKSTQA